MLDKKFSPERQSAFAARFEAQKIAFGPVVFQCVRYAWKRGILQRAAAALTPQGQLLIMDTFWDRQRYDIGYCHSLLRFGVAGA